jgi:hypothetical protein
MTTIGSARPYVPPPPPVPPPLTDAEEEEARRVLYESYVEEPNYPFFGICLVLGLLLLLRTLLALYRRYQADNAVIVDPFPAHLQHRKKKLV